MKRAARLLLASTLLACAHLSDVAQAEPRTGVSRIGVLNPQGAPSSVEAGLREGLRKLNYIEGKNAFFEWRRSAATQQELRAQANDLGSSNVDLIVTIGSPATRAALEVTTKPVVFFVGDPVGAGFAASLARPGGNASGVSIQTTDLNRKRLELLRQLLPAAKRFIYLANSSNPVTTPDLAEMQAGSRALGVNLIPLSARNDAEVDAELSAIRQRIADGVMVSADLTLLANKVKIARAVREAKMPAVFPYREYHDEGVLMSYGPNMAEATYRVATYVDRVLKGANPGELPIEQISAYELVIDLRIAREMRIRVPQELLLRANETIQ